MRSSLRLIAMTLVVGLLGAGSAQAVTTTSTFTPTPFTKAVAGGGNAVSATFNWKPVIWDPTSPTDKQDIVVETGAKVSHVFNQSGTFVGELRVKDRAGNTSNPRSFTVKSTGAPAGAPRPGAASPASPVRPPSSSTG